MKKNGYLLVGLFLTWISCSPKNELTFVEPVFPDTIGLKGKVLVDSFIMGACVDINCYQDVLLVCGYTGGEEEYVHLFEKETGRHIKSILPKGRGAGEALTVPHLDIETQTGTAFFYDYVGRRLHHFQIDSIIKHTNVTDYLFSCNYTYMGQVFKTPKGFAGIRGLRKKDGRIPRLFLIEQDTISNEYYQHPSVHISGKYGIVSSYIYANYCISPNGNKIASASTYGAILEIFDITSGLRLDTIKGFVRPVYSVDKNGFLKILPKETTWGFLDICATNNYIYAIYCGGTDLQKRNEIAVFDWKGNEICLYKTDYLLECICVDEKTNKLYATSWNATDEKIIIEFELA